MYSSRDNWERLVTAVVRKQQIWELFHSHSRSPSISTIASSDDNDDFSEQFLEWAATSSSVSPLPLSNPPSASQVGSKSGEAITRKLFPASWYRAKETKQEYHIFNIPGVRTFSLNELKIATNNFADKNILFRDVFAKSYKGRLENGFMVAVKRFKQVNNDISPAQQQYFQAEVETMRIAAAHPNLLRVIGGCFTEKQKLLVYPYMVKGTVASCLRDRPKSRPPFGWQVRKQIALGAARGLAYLHDGCEQKIICRDEMMRIVAAHPNLLRVIGGCLTQKEKLLVYPYMANGTVASCLRDRSESRPPLDWSVRKRIALGAARGLAYLHDGCERKIIYRNFKAANVFLNEKFEAIIGNFEFSIHMDHDVSHLKDGVRGTVGHIAPEYLSKGILSEKSDVFVYGIFLLELITGQKAFDLARLATDEDVLLLDWVKTNLMDMIVDPDFLGYYFIEEEVEQLIKIALLCTQDNPESRPNMSEIVRMIWEDLMKRSDEQWDVRLLGSPTRSDELLSPR